MLRPWGVKAAEFVGWWRIRVIPQAAVLALSVPVRMAEAEMQRGREAEAETQKQKQI